MFNRIENLRQLLKQNNLEAIIIQKPENYLYLSGFNGTSATLIITVDDLILITDSRYTEQAKDQASLYKIIQYQNAMSQTMADILREKKIQNVGFEADFLTYEKYNFYKEKLNVENFIPIKSTTEAFRKIKDEREIETIKAAVKIADDAFSHVLKFIKPGVTESDIAAEIEYYMKKNGAKGTSFETIVASGHRAALPHGVASNKKIENSEIVVIDFGAIYENYCSDMTRTIFVGDVPKQLKEIYNIVLKAQVEAIQGINTGMTGKEIDKIARDIISSSGYKEYFGHGLGHGVGIEVHEDPKISPLGEEKIQDNMVFTVEPGIYISNLGGVRIEDMVLIQNQKGIPLTKSTKEMIML